MKQDLTSFGDLPDFAIKTNGPISRAFSKLKIQRFYGVINYVKNIPYGRNSSKTDLLTVLTENKGTCSSKHALIKVLLDEHEVNSIHLILGTYQMKEENTKGVGAVLEGTGLDYIPEAHNYLLYRGNRYDFTFPGTSKTSPFPYLMEEIRISPEQIDCFKVDYHKKFLGNWIKNNNLDSEFDVEKVWRLREACIHALSNKN